MTGAEPDLSTTGAGGSDASGGSDVVIRPMHWTDIPTVARLEAELFAADAWSAQTWWAELAQRPRRVYLAAQSSRGLVGYAGLDLRDDVADVMTIAVARSGQGHGVGQQLLDRLTREAMGHGAARVLLEVRSDNGPARRLYARNDFEVIDVRRRYYQPGDVDALVMRHALPDATR